jgi:hypothetical protein
MRRPAHTLAFAAALILPAAVASAEPEGLFPPATPACYVGAEIKPEGTGTLPDRKPAVPVTAVRLERGYPQLALDEEEHPPRSDGDRLLHLRVVVTFADAGRPGAVKRYTDGLYGVLRCTADICDGISYKVERQADGTVLLRMTGGINVGGGTYRTEADRRLPDGHVYRLVASPMAACH